MQRKTQADRRSDTQNALLEATIESLVDLGYARTTTREVAERAGVSRGAQSHHYPTKSSLVVAAVEHLFDKLALRFIETFDAVEADERTLERAIAELWELVRGSTYAAVLEVIVASRTDPELQVVVHAVAARLEQTVLDLVNKFFPAIDDPELASAVVNLGFTIVQGAAVTSYAGFGNPEETIRQIRLLASLATPETAKLASSVLHTSEPIDSENKP